MRHDENTNLILHIEPFFEGLPVQTECGPLAIPYLQRTRYVIDQSLFSYGRVFAFRCDLRFPEGWDHASCNENRVLDRFFASFKAKIRHNRDRALANNPYAHDTAVRYVWCREIGQHCTPHFHVVILLNGNAFCTLGAFELGRDNLFNRVNEAWASALGIYELRNAGLVEFPKNPFYLLRRDDPESISEFFYRVSYMCKADTKHYGDGTHGFGSSRV
jgi:hypothetical protein